MDNQTTIKHKASLQGTSITGEADAKVTFYPAPPDTGVIFIRNDLPGCPRVKCSFANAKVEYRWTTLIHGNISIEHTEHALAAISGLDLANVFIELAQPSLPVTPDYSSKEFVRVLLNAGIEQQPFGQGKLKIHKPIVIFKRDSFENLRNEKLLIALPYDGFKLTYFLDYPNLPQLYQNVEIDITPETFIKELADARSYVLESEFEGIVNSTGRVSASDWVIKSGADRREWQWPNELARHKALDLLGDLSLLGKKLQGHVIGIRSGHRLNLELCEKIFKECKND